MKTLVFASNNAHKLHEIRAMNPRFTILSLQDIQFDRELPETMGTIEGNAIQKAKTLYELTGMDCFADDSGLEVKALHGKPGVDSADYAGQNRNNEANINKLLHELSGAQDRSARFVTVIALVIEGEVKVFEGEVKGHVTQGKSGNHGFGYDPVFIPEGYDQTFGELSPEIKNTISHRANALVKLSDWLREKE